MLLDISSYTYWFPISFVKETLFHPSRILQRFISFFLPSHILHTMVHLIVVCLAVCVRGGKRTVHSPFTKILHLYYYRIVGLFSILSHAYLAGCLSLFHSMIVNNAERPPFSYVMYKTGPSSPYKITTYGT